MKAYSQDLRERIVGALEAREETQPELASRFAVSLSFVEKLWRRWRQTGSCAARPHAGGQRRRLAGVEPWLRQEVARRPDATLAELCERVVQQGGAPVSVKTMCVELQRLGLPRKKKMVHASEQETERIQAERATYRARSATWLFERVKFLDETGLTIALTRLYGRAAPGVRVHEAVPKNYGERLTVLAVLDLQGLSAPMTVDGAVDGDVFRVYVEQVLGPTLQPGDIVAMDNLAAHKVAGIETAIEARGARVEYLPAYSPDLNPIEQCWAKLKTALRTAKARTRAALEGALEAALRTITPADALAWFQHCGYAVH